jgi:hypothetical protein
MFDKAHGSHSHRPRRRRGRAIAVALALVLGAVIVGVLAITTASPSGIGEIDPVRTPTLAHASILRYSSLGRASPTRRHLAIAV